MNKNISHIMVFAFWQELYSKKTKITNFHDWQNHKNDVYKKSTRKAHKAEFSIKEWINAGLSKEDVLLKIQEVLGLTEKSSIIYYYRYNK